MSLADSEVVTSSGSLLRQLVARYLARTLHSQEVFPSLIHELIRLAEHALIKLDLTSLDEASRILMKLPVDAARQIGSYYYALAIYRKGQRAEADALLEKIADDGPITYRAQAVQALGAHLESSGQLDEALRFQLESLRMASDRNANGLRTTLMASLDISIIKSLSGDHKGALSSLRSLGPLVNLVAKQEPFYFYGYCSELAIELGELGRVAEAKQVLDVALSSPYASAYPNWAETREELEAKRTSATPSVVAINQAAEVIPGAQTQPQPCLVHSQPSQIRKRVFAFCWLSSRGAFHRASITIAGFISIVNCQTNRITLDQLGRCIQSRAPPTYA